MSEEERPISDWYSACLPERLSGAEKYTYCDDIWVITCYFNPSKYQTKPRNFYRFESAFRKSRINLCVVECAFGESDFALQEVAGVVRVRSQHVLWQKERLINVAIARLPRHVRKIAWVDCDILFSNPDWLVETSKLLDRYPLVQPFQTAIRLPREHRQYVGQGEAWQSFGYSVNQNAEAAFAGSFHLHGHTGFAWAARRDLAETHGLYDAFITGSGDHFMAHAMCGDFSSGCFDLFPMSNHHKRHFSKWGKDFHHDVCGNIGYLSGEVLHLWHGDTESRKYVRRHGELIQHDFDPQRDLGIEDSGAWYWKSEKPGLHQWAIEYFNQRNEDGEL